MEDLQKVHGRFDFHIHNIANRCKQLKCLLIDEPFTIPFKVCRCVVLLTYKLKGGGELHLATIRCDARSVLVARPTCHRRSRLAIYMRCIRVDRYVKEQFSLLFVLLEHMRRRVERQLPVLKNYKDNCLCALLRRCYRPSKSVPSQPAKLQKLQCRSVFLTISHCILNADLTKTHSSSVTFQRFCRLGFNSNLNVIVYQFLLIHASFNGPKFKTKDLFDVYFIN